MKAFIVGATGEVGKSLIKELAKAEIFDCVTLITRRKIDLLLNSGDQENYQKFSQIIVDFDNLQANHAAAFQGFDVGFCALGTTKAKSGSAGLFKVDYDYVLASAILAKAGGCKHFSLVSSHFSSKDSIFFYLRIKGMVEEACKALNFDRLSIYQPGMLLVSRSEQRPIENLFQMVSKLDFLHFLSIEVLFLSKAMVDNTFQSSKYATYGVKVYSNKHIYNLAKS